MAAALWPCTAHRHKQGDALGDPADSLLRCVSTSLSHQLHKYTFACGGTHSIHRRRVSDHGVRHARFHPRVQRRCGRSEQELNPLTISDWFPWFPWENVSDSVFGKCDSPTDECINFPQSEPGKGLVCGRNVSICSTFLFYYFSGQIQL